MEEDQALGDRESRIAHGRTQDAASLRRNPADLGAQEFTRLDSPPKITGSRHQFFWPKNRTSQNM